MFRSHIEKQLGGFPALCMILCSAIALAQCNTVIVSDVDAGADAEADGDTLIDTDTGADAELDAELDANIDAEGQDDAASDSDLVLDADDSDDASDGDIQADATDAADATLDTDHSDAQRDDGVESCAEAVRGACFVLSGCNDLPDHLYGPAVACPSYMVDNRALSLDLCEAWLQADPENEMAVYLIATPSSEVETCARSQSCDNELATEIVSALIGMSAEQSRTDMLTLVSASTTGCY